MEKARINLGKAAPELYQGVIGLDKHAKDLAAAAGLAEGFAHLLRLRASQINQCAYCVRMPDHIYEAAATILNDQEIAAVEWLAIVMNAWNRIAISSRYLVKP